VFVLYTVPSFALFFFCLSFFSVFFSLNDLADKLFAGEFSHRTCLMEHTIISCYFVYTLFFLFLTFLFFFISYFLFFC